MKYLFLVQLGILFTFYSKANAQQQKMVRLAFDMFSAPRRIAPTRL